MSEQNQSNFQALGAGLLGFVVVVSVGGGALMVHNSHNRAAAKPAAAGAPIDIGAPVPSRFESAPSRPQSERRAESPAPLIGGQDEASGSSAQAVPAARSSSVSAAAAASSPEAAPAEAGRLKVTEHLEAKGATTAEAVVKNTLAEKEAEEKEAAQKPAPKAKLDKKAVTKFGPAAGTEVASVHYGVTDRSELMGRAAGPVYNIKGNGAAGGQQQMGKMAEDMNSKVSDLKRQLEATGLPADQRDKLIKDLAEATKGMKSAAAQ